MRWVGTIGHTMKITVITLFPQMMSQLLGESILGRAQTKGAVTIDVVNLRDYATDSYGTVDDRPYGGGAGMVLRVDVLARALGAARHEQSSKPFVLLTSAKGIPYTQSKAHELTKLEHLLIICGRYEGVDERIMPQIDEEVSLGDFVMTGGEIAAAAVIDSVVRLLPGVLKKEDATEDESFMHIELAELMSAVGKTEQLSSLVAIGRTHVQLLEYAHFTRPEMYEGVGVPEILLCGDPKKIRVWKLQQAYAQTVEKRPDLLE